tara:strand:+ start:324 stop:566 length:243 start_codon:yes stop_codon:yes gene_type:complete
MAESNILTPQEVSMANEAEPHEVLLAIHKRVVDTEKLMIQYRTHAQNMDVEIGMIKERIEKLEKVKEDIEDAWKKFSYTD